MFARPHIFFPHKNSYQEGERRSEGWGRGGAEGFHVQFVLALCLERKLSLLGDLWVVSFPGESESRFPACKNPLFNIKLGFLFCVLLIQCERCYIRCGAEVLNKKLLRTV